MQPFDNGAFNGPQGKTAGGGEKFSLLFKTKTTKTQK